MAIQQRKDTTPDDNKMHVTSVLAQQHDHAILDRDATLDEQTLGALGYKQEFKRSDHDHELLPSPVILQAQSRKISSPIFLFTVMCPAYALH